MDWDDELLRNYVHHDDIPQIKSLAVSRTHKRDSFLWAYTKSGQYMVKSGYWVAQKFLRGGAEEEMIRPSIADLQAFAWKVKAPQKICHLIWQLLSGYVAVTRNLNRRNMRCDDFCPRCGSPEESVTHAIFECPPAVQSWALSATPSSHDVFPKPSIYANMDYLFWRKNENHEETDRDPYPWIIWYLWKARNDKLFNGIDRDPMELVRFAEAECNAWFDANLPVEPLPGEGLEELEPELVSLTNICLVDRSWREDAVKSGCGWVWLDGIGNPLLMGMRNFTRRDNALQTEVEALRWAMEVMLQQTECQIFGTDCKDVIEMINNPAGWPAFATELESIQLLKICFSAFKIVHVPRARNVDADALARSSRMLERDVCYFGCSIPVWFPRPHQA